MTLPGGGTWSYDYLGEVNGVLPNGSFYNIMEGKDDPNSAMPALRFLTDDQGRRVDYISDSMGTMLDVRFNQTFDAQSNLVSYNEAAYDIGQIDFTDTHRRAVDSFASKKRKRETLFSAFWEEMENAMPGVEVIRRGYRMLHNNVVELRLNRVPDL